ncbi:hypothetical protein A7K50_01325 [Dehalobacter sp. MCB1]|uniref:hypothetical protein n=1 Tax=unclassified Dehalobacter TaxID=2635733 RepID=UPI000E6B994E|nr:MULTISPECIES: hypothetical protein [unclassified Dehalobacter]RJE47912.1 hypothetical protein A7K50_01325 [Dehalobacter sp. MCB1]TCX56090.1 hypothetical protein C1I38_00805 [Dehalobacter sp. 12DCB1]
MIKIPITFNSDEKGYLDRECPNENCLFAFKVYMDDWKEKISDEEVHCPMCGHVDTSDKWWTQKQLEDMRRITQSFAMEYIHEELDKTFRDLEHSTRHNKFMKFTYKPGSRTSFNNNPLGQSKEWEQEIQCPQCYTHYSVIGSAYFCPCCGFNAIEDVIDESLDTIVKMIESLSEMEELLTQSFGKDKAITMCRAMLEGSLGDVVSAFQKFAEMKYKSLSCKVARVNDFQIVEKGSNLFQEATGKGYDEWLTKNEISEMTLMFQKRHIFEHNGGIVDEMYMRKSGDSSYKIGQRLVLRREDTLKLIQIVKTLCVGIKTLS